MAHYALVDEPRPGPLAGYAVRPFWILIGLMLGGAWLAFPWFVFNAHAVGSPSKNREIGLAVAYFGVATFAAMVAVLLGEAGLPAWVVRYLLLGVVVIKAGAALGVATLQSRTVDLFEDVGGVVGHPIAVLAGGWLLRGLILPRPTDAVRQVLLAVLQ